jgi:hypothetical protein
MISVDVMLWLLLVAPPSKESTDSSSQSSSSQREIVRDEVDPVLIEWLESLPTGTRFFVVEVGESLNLGGGEDNGCFLEGESSHRLSAIIGLTAFRFVTMNSG